MNGSSIGYYGSASGSRPVGKSDRLEKETIQTLLIDPGNGLSRNAYRHVMPICLAAEKGSRMAFWTWNSPYGSAQIAVYLLLTEDKLSAKSLRDVQRRWR
jgi:hypothetical protein